MIVREERIGGQRLILGDCLEVMPLLGLVDAVVTDPPYGIDQEGAGYGRGGRTIAGDTTLDAMRDGVRGAWALCPAGWALVFYSARVTPGVMAALPADDYAGEIIWDKKAPGLGGNFRYQHENIAILKRAAAPKMRRPLFSVQVAYRAANVHPHEKPAQLMRTLIEALPSAVILDPFMGSGTTLVAAEKLGRKGTGIEIDPAYFETACRRVEAAARQPDMFGAQSERPVQHKLFGAAE